MPYLKTFLEHIFSKNLQNGNIRYEGSYIALVDLFEQVIAESVDNPLYGPLPGPARVCMTLLGH